MMLNLPLHDTIQSINILCFDAGKNLVSYRPQQIMEMGRPIPYGILVQDKIFELNDVVYARVIYKNNNRVYFRCESEHDTEQIRGQIVNCIDKLLEETSTAWILYINLKH